ncbi:MAG: hypothetical protein H0X46_07170 [Bacteroidetes bacterium]|nr:hypothetical protein [Bacteroidota bacterium]
MKKVFLVLLFAMSVFCGFSHNRENDSINKRITKCRLGISLESNYSWRQYDDSAIGQILFWKPQNESPAIGYSIMLNERIIHNRFMLNISSGIGFYNFKGNYQYDLPSYPPAKAYTLFVNYKFKHVFIELCTDYNILFGKNRSWNLGLLSEVSVLARLTQDVTWEYRETSSGIKQSEDINSLDFGSGGFVLWGGLRAGKSYTISKSLIMNFSLNCKYSSLIRTGSATYKIRTIVYAQPKNIMALSLNIIFYPKFKRK